MVRQVIGIMGGMGNGKDTLCEALQAVNETRPKPLRILHCKFATCMREVVAKIIGTTPAFLESAEGKSHYFEKFAMTGREAQQRIAEALRGVNPDIWVLALDANVSQHEAEYDVLVISDLRYPNEWEWVRTRFEQSHVVRIHRTGEAPLTADTHESERHWRELPADAIIDNVGTLEEMQAKCQKITRSLLGEE